MAGVIAKALCLAACVLALSGPATAQTSDAMAVLNSCVENAETGEEARGCIGTGAAMCIDGHGGSASFTDPPCYDNETAWWEARLTRLNTTLLAEAQVNDAIFAAIGQRAGVEDDLRHLQLSWLRYRDAACGYVQAQWGLGSGATTAFARCMMRRTGEHVVALAWDLSVE